MRLLNPAQALSFDLSPLVHRFKVIRRHVLHANLLRNKGRIWILSDSCVGLWSNIPSHDESILVNLLIPCLLSRLVLVLACRSSRLPRSQNKHCFYLQVLIALELRVGPLLLNYDALVSYLSLLVLNQASEFLDLLLVELLVALLLIHDLLQLHLE